MNTNEMSNHTVKYSDQVDARLGKPQDQEQLTGNMPPWAVPIPVSQNK